jgi:hypothetical protein
MEYNSCRARLKPDGTRWRTRGEVKEKLANGVGSQNSRTTLERGVSSITTADAHTTAASSRPNWRPRRFKWTRPFRRKTKSGFCACTITFRTQSNLWLTGNQFLVMGKVLGIVAEDVHCSLLSFQINLGNINKRRSGSLVSLSFKE